eukprot:598970-Pelagomonas_calceolata.AAC.2
MVFEAQEVKNGAQDAEMAMQKQALLNALCTVVVMAANVHKCKTALMVEVVGHKARMARSVLLHHNTSDLCTAAPAPKNVLFFTESMTFAPPSLR